MKTKFEFKSAYIMTDEEAKRHEKYIKKHKPKGLSFEEVLLTKYLNKDKRKRGKK